MCHAESCASPETTVCMSTGNSCAHASLPIPGHKLRVVFLPVYSLCFACHVLPLSLQHQLGPVCILLYWIQSETKWMTKVHGSDGSDDHNSLADGQPLVVKLHSLGMTILSRAMLHISNSVDWCIIFYASLTNDVIVPSTRWHHEYWRLHNDWNNLWGYPYTWKCICRQYSTGTDTSQHSFSFLHCQTNVNR